MGHTRKIRHSCDIFEKLFKTYLKSQFATKKEFYTKSISNIDYYVFKSYYVMTFSLSDKLQNLLLLNQTAV